LFDAIASGGMASVHIGRLMGAFGFSRTVAIKRLHRESALEPNFVAMFSDEARLAARIRHPNVVSTLDVVAHGEELLLVMEYVSGAALSQILHEERKQGRPTPQHVAVDIMIGVLNGLHAAHEATSENGARLDIVHRDVSPQNILVGADGIARVLDFGIAKAIGGSHQSLPNEIKGKLRYLSPESVTAEPVTRASDIYSASVVLWEMLAGRRLFNDKNNCEVISEIMQGVTVPPSQLRPHVSDKLDAIVMRGLSRDPRARHRSARAMAIELEAAVNAVARSAVSSWVLASVGEQIRDRDSLVARIERAARVESRLGTPLAARRDSVTEITRLDGEARAAVPASDKPAAFDAKRRRVLAWLGFVVCAAAFGWFVRTRSSSDSPERSPLPSWPAPPDGESLVAKLETLSTAATVPSLPKAPEAAFAPRAVPTDAPTAVPGAGPALLEKPSAQRAKRRFIHPTTKRPAQKSTAPVDALYRRD
jgi:serine/threonine-protein kinase